VLASLRREAAAAGIGYQTLIHDLLVSYTRAKGGGK
jgi:predicted DNA binding CopG/RHH family protein